MKKLKRTISLMILAGVLTASLASCVVKGNNPPDPTGNETVYSPVTGGPGVTPIIPTTDPSQVTYAPVDETVYITAKNAVLKLVANTAESIQLGQITELHRIGKSSSWSKVEYNGQQYYIASSLLTTDDLMEKTFTACSKTMYVNTGSVNVRQYPSAENSYSTILGSRVQGDEVKVIGENGTWSKIKWTNEGTEYTGFIKSSFLSVDRVNGTDDFLKYFTALDSPVTMYVSTATANVRTKPYADTRGPIATSVPDGLPKGTAVTVVARGTVEEVAWSMVEWAEGSIKKQYYVATSCLDVTAGEKATLEQVLKVYPELEKFESAQNLYICDNQAFGRGTPTRLADKDGNPTNVIKMLYKKDAVTAVAAGKIAGQAPDGKEEAITWCLIQDADIGFYFVAYSCLTRNADGTPAAPVLSLDQILNMYGFEKTSTAISMKVKAEKASIYTEPDGSAAAQLDKGTIVSVVAKGETGSFVKNSWYLIEYNGSYYFVIQGDLEIN
ncbi:MAG: hypothetical protein E7620_00595 [Ruminococcaceae bacterium]|nr:hypothetical protein [Oscillospiraceae bacterium]